MPLQHHNVLMGEMMMMKMMYGDVVDVVAGWMHVWCQVLKNNMNM